MYTRNPRLWKSSGSRFKGNLRVDHWEPYVPFRWVNTELSVQLRKANMDIQVGPYRIFVLPGHKLHKCVRQLGHSQTSSAKNFLRMHLVKAYVMPRCNSPFRTKLIGKPILPSSLTQFYLIYQMHLYIKSSLLGS